MVLLGVVRWLLLCCYGVARCFYGVAMVLLGCYKMVVMVLWLLQGGG